MSTLVAERPSTVPTVSPVVRTSPKPQPDPFEGRPLARMLHVAGITTLSKTFVRRTKRDYKRKVCAQKAAIDARGGSFFPCAPRTEAGNYESLMRLTHWRRFLIGMYRMNTSQGFSSSMGVGFISPPIPSEIEAIAKEVEARMPNAVLLVEAFYKDPFLIVSLGNEFYYIAHWD